MIISEALQLGRVVLDGAADSPEIDTDRLLLKVIGRNESSWMIAHGEEKLSSIDATTFIGFLDRRKSGEPLAYILGEWEFYGRKFYITSEVLVPRPATEGLIDEALRLSEAMAGTLERHIVVADVGTGSGCIAITLLLESPQIDHIFATDISTAVLTVAQENVARYGLEGRITLLEGDMLEPLASEAIDLVVSNPPYVPSVELEKMDTIDTRGLKFEPMLSLDGGHDGMRFVNQIKRQGWPAVFETVGGEVERSWF